MGIQRRACSPEGRPGVRKLRGPAEASQPEVQVEYLEEPQGALQGGPQEVQAQEGQAHGPTAQEDPPDPSQEGPIPVEGEAGRGPSHHGVLSSQPRCAVASSNRGEDPSPSPLVPSRGEEVPVDPSLGAEVLGHASLGVVVLLDPSRGAVVLWGPILREEVPLSAPILLGAEGLLGPSLRAVEAIHQAAEGPNPQEADAPSQVDPYEA